MYSPGLIIAFDSAHASIPAGWERATEFDGKFIKGTAAATEPGVNGGSPTHSHTSPAHTHTLSAHTHTYRTNDALAGGSTGATPGGGYVIACEHYHTGTSGAVVGGTLSDALTYGAVSNNPPYYEFIFIRSLGYNFIPNNGVIFSKETSRPGLSFHSASASKFLRGAGTAQNAGSIGGSSTNTHDISHSHTPVTHTHAEAWSSTGQEKCDRNGGGHNTNGDGYDQHNHKIGLTAGTQTADAYSGSLVTAETVEPAHRTINPYKNDSGNNVLPAVGDVAMWDGLLADIPIGWVLCDGSNGTLDMRDQFVKVPASAASSTTGGANTHTHATQNHTHTTSSSHNHPGFSNASHVENLGAEPGQDDLSRQNPSGSGSIFDTVALQLSHTVNNISSTLASYSTGATTADSAENQPEYRTIAFIQLQFLSGGSAISKMLN